MCYTSNSLLGYCSVSVSVSVFVEEEDETWRENMCHCKVAFSFVFMWGEWECNMETKKERDQEGVQ